MDRQLRGPMSKQEVIDFTAYMKGVEHEKARGLLAGAALKRFHRARIRLIKSGMLKEMSKEQIRVAAADAFARMPFWSRWRIRATFWWNRAKLRLSFLGFGR